ncbi:DUF3558 family protein [Actinokineospora sp.]|uniref:DUF3558 family protein n=1 Tax=Actinokineospora sp. TaxID=1872133 RepID=UPI004037FA0B
MLGNKVGLLGLVVLMGTVTACSNPGSESPPPQTSSAPPSSTSARAVAPEVERPLSLGDHWMKPCELLHVWMPENLGFGETEGQPDRTENATTCRWAATDPKIDSAVSLEIAAYPDTDILGDAYANTPATPGVFKPTSLIIPRLPAAYVRYDPLVCAVVVGLSDRQGLKVTYGRQKSVPIEVAKDSCFFAFMAASDIVGNLRNGN